MAIDLYVLAKILEKFPPGKYPYLYGISGMAYKYGKRSAEHRMIARENAIPSSVEYKIEPQYLVVHSGRLAKQVKRFEESKKPPSAVKSEEEYPSELPKELKIDRVKIPVVKYKEPTRIESFTWLMEKYKDYKDYQITKPSDAYELIQKLTKYPKECIGAIYLTGKNKVLEVEILGIGTPTMAIMDLPSLIRSMALIGAMGLILFHNHPSGEVEPSEEDIKLAERINAMCDFLGYKLLDALIVGDGKYYSMREKGIFDSFKKIKLGELL